MKSQALIELKVELRQLIKNPDVKQFVEIVRHCPSSKLYGYNIMSERTCPSCPLYNGTTCRLSYTRNVYWDYRFKRIDEESALAKSTFSGIKLLAYLESKR